jgi:hypothetical protein
MGRDVAGKDLRIVMQYCIRTKEEYISHTTSLVHAVLFAQAGFQRDQIADALRFSHDHLSSATQDVGAFITGESWPIGGCNLKCTANIVYLRLGHTANEVVGVWVVYSQGVGPTHTLTIDTHAFFD